MSINRNEGAMRALMSRGSARGERGISTMELVVAIALLSVLGAIIAALVINVNRSNASSLSVQQQQASILDSMNQISREITNSTPIIKADREELITQTERDGRCVGYRYVLMDTGTAKWGEVLLRQTYNPTNGCSSSPVAEYSWPELPTFNEDGMTSGTGRAHVLVSRVKLDDTTQKLFSYVDGNGYSLDSFVPLTVNGTGNSDAAKVARVDILINAWTVNDGYVTLTTSAVPRNHITGDNNLGEILPPMCPRVSGTVSDGTVRLEWAPVEGAIHYQVTRTQGSDSQVRVTMPANGGAPTGPSPGIAPRWSAGDQIPYWGENVSTTGGVLSYTVTVETANGWSPACTPWVVSIELPDPVVAVEVLPGPAPSSNVTAPEWDGNRSTAASASQPAASSHPYFRVRWGTGTQKNQPIQGASGYSVQMMEINPSTGNPLTGTWENAPGYEGKETDPSDPTLEIRTGPEGRPLWGREFKFRIQNLGGSGNSDWTVVETDASGPVQSQAGVNSANRGFLVYPAAPEVSVTSSGTGSANVSWRRDTTLDISNRRDDVTYSVQFQQRNGRTSASNAAVPAISYSASAWSPVTVRQNTTLTSYTHNGLPAGDLTSYRVRACSSGPYPLQASSTSCGPWSRPFSALQRPEGLLIGGTPDHANRRNRVVWGREYSGTPASFDTQRVNSYNIRARQTTDSATWGSSNDLWTGSTAQAAWHTGRNAGDYTRYRAQACNTTSGLARTVGGGCGEWSGDSARVWQTPAPPTCVSSATWRSLTGTINRSSTPGARGYINSASTIQNAQISLSGGYTGGSSTRNASTYTWTDPNPEIRPSTSHTIRARLQNQAGWSDWGSDCGRRTAAPPAVGTPSISSSISGNDISWSWTKPTNGSYYQLRNSNGSYIRYTGVERSSTAWNQPYGVQQCGKVRAAYNDRLAGWGFWGSYSGTSCRTPVPPPPSSCSVSGATATSLYVSTRGGYGTQVRISGGSWRSPGTFSGLRANTSYTFEARSYANGMASGSVYCGGRTTWITYGDDSGFSTSTANVCYPFRSSATFVLRAAINAMGAKSGGLAVYDSITPTHWRYLRGDQADGTLQCVFARWVVLVDPTTREQIGRGFASAIWFMGGSDAV